MLDFLKTYGVQMLACLGALWGLLTAIAAVTPTKRDDQWVAWLKGKGWLAKALAWLSRAADRYGAQVKSPKADGAEG